MFVDLTDAAWEGVSSDRSGDVQARGTGLVVAASELAFDLLGEDEQRWRHTQAVAARAEQAAVVLPVEHVPALLAAGWLHDIGYAQPARHTGFHPLDGAHYLAERGWPPLVAGLVAHHSAARYVADVRGLHAQLRRFDQPLFMEGPLADALTWADQTTSPNGATVDVSTRLAEMLDRHGPASPTALVHRLRGPVIEQAVADTTDLLLLYRAGQRLARR